MNDELEIMFTNHSICVEVKGHKEQFGIAGLPAKIRTRDLPKTKWKC
jgi:hypothetical protein